MKRKVLGNLVAIVLVAGMLAGCGGSPAPESSVEGSSGGAEGTQDTGESEESTAEDATDLSGLSFGPYGWPVAADLDYSQPYNKRFDGMEFTRIVNTGAAELPEGMDVDNNSFTWLFESVTGMKPKAMWEASGDAYSQKLNQAIASGEIPDLMKVGMNQYYMLVKSGLVADLTDELRSGNHPTIQSMYEAGGGAALDILEVDGRIYGIPQVNAQFDGSPLIWIRKDWMEKLNMTEPTTLDELHDLLYAFTYNDPDGNGKDDTYGIDVIYNWRGMWPIFGAFGISTPNQYNVREDGTVYLNGALEDYRTALGILKEWYDEGIIHPECITDDRAAVRTKWANGTVGTMVDSQTWFYSFRGASSILAMAEDVFGEGTVDVMSALTSEYGDGTIYSNCNYPNAAGVASLLFGANATDEQVIAVLKMLEGMATDHELLTKMLYGEEGVDYTMVDGQLCVNPELTVADKAEKGIDFTFYAVGATDPYMETLTFSQRDKENIDKSNSWPTLPMTNFDCPVNAARDQYQSEVSKVVSEYYTNVLLGADNLEDGWDRYLQNLDNAGLGKIIAEYEERMK